MDIFALLRESFPQLCMEHDFRFSRFTTIGCGGGAAACVHPDCEEELAALLTFLEKQSIPHCFLGAGANVLPQDDYFEGVVIRFDRMNALSDDGTAISAGAGATGGALLRFARQKSIGGFEFLTGIPMTVGGATVMNAGVQEGHLADVVTGVLGVENGRIRYFTPQDCAFSVKTSIFQGGIAVARVFLRGSRSSKENIATKTEHFREKRRHLPKGRSMGCVFVNPPDGSAGAIIERCGLKGLSNGRAHVSEAHGNFIINEGGTAAEISALIAAVKEKVFEKTGILLKEEIRRIP